MGIIDSIRAIRTSETPKASLTASHGGLPAHGHNSPLDPFLYEITGTTVSRQQSMAIPSVARARNIISGTIAALPLKRWNKTTGRELPPVEFQYQPDPSTSRIVTYAWIIDSMLFYGGAFVYVLSVAGNGRVKQFRWIDPLRVGVQTDITGTIVEYYTLDGERVPMNGVGSLKYIPAFDEGLLNRSAEVILTASELQSAAKRASQEPTPTVVLKNSGVELPAGRVVELLDAWKQARRTRSTAFLNSALDVETIGFNPKDQQLVEARIFTTGTEIARAVGLPSWYLNAEANSMTYSNVESERRNLIDFSLKPYMTALQDRLNMPDFSEPSSEFRFDVSDFLRSSAIEEKEIINGFLESGVISVEEARARLDLTARGN